MKNQRVGLWCAILVLGITGLLIQGCDATHTCDTDSAGKPILTNCGGIKPDMTDSGDGCSVYQVGLSGTCTGCSATGQTYRTGTYQTCTDKNDSTKKGTEAQCGSSRNGCANNCKVVAITGVDCPAITDVIECDDVNTSCNYVDPGASLSASLRIPAEDRGNEGHKVR
jgi:hypothetical protein